LSPISSFMRLVSVALCLIVGASFLLFVVNQTGSASAQQQRELNNEPAPGVPATTSAGGAPQSGAARDGAKSSPRRVIDEVAEAVTSPFSALTESWSSEWLKRGVLLLLTLAIYGFGLSFVA